MWSALVDMIQHALTNRRPIPTAMSTDSNPLLSFLESLSSESLVSEVSSAKAAIEEKPDCELSLSELRRVLQHGFYVPHVEIDVSVACDEEDGVSCSNIVELSSLRPDVDALESYGAWRYIVDCCSDDYDTILADFQRCLYHLETDFLNGARNDFSLVDATAVSDDAQAARWASATTLIPSLHLFRANNKESCCLLTFASKAFAQRLAELGVHRTYRIVDTAADQSANRFLSVGGASSNRRKGYTFLLKGDFAIKAVHLSLMELLAELLVTDIQYARALPLFLSSTYFPRAQRLPVSFAWLHHNAAPVPTDPTTVRIAKSLKLSGVLNINCVSEVVEHCVRFIRRFQRNRRKSMSNRRGADGSLVGFAVLEKYPLWAATSTSLHGSLGPSRSLTKLAQLNQRSQSSLGRSEGLKDPFLSVVAKNAEPAATSVANGSRPRPFALKQISSQRRALEAGTDAEMAAHVVVKVGHFRKLPAFALLRQLAEGSFAPAKDEKLSFDITDSMQCLWSQDGNGGGAGLRWTDDDALAEQRVQWVERKRGTMELQAVALQSYTDNRGGDSP